MAIASTCVPAHAAVAAKGALRRPPLRPMLREVVALVAGTSAIINGLGVIGAMPQGSLWA